MNTWEKEEIGDVLIKFILFLFSPIIGAFYATRKIKSRSSFIVFFLFAVCFGMAFTVPPVKDHNNMFDGARYRQKFEHHEENYKELDYFTVLKMAPLIREKDYYYLSLNHLISQYSSNYHFLFLLVSIVFAIYALKSMKFLVLEKNFHMTIGGLILISMFMWNHIFNINGRFWTAAWIGIYCIFQVFKNGQSRYLLLALVTPLIHAAFWVYLIVMFGAYIVKRSHKPWIVLYLISFVASNLSVELARSITDLLPPILAKFASAYTSETYIEKQSTGSGFYWVSVLFTFMQRAFMNLLVVLFIKNIHQVSSNPKSDRLFSFLLIWMTFVNFTMPIPSLGERFMAMSYPIIAYIWLVNFYNLKYTKVLYAMPFIYLFVYYKRLKLYSVVLEPSFFVSSPLYLVYKYLIAA